MSHATRRIATAAVVVALVVTLGGTARAGVIIDITQVGSDVDATAVGTLNTTGLSSGASGNASDQVNGSIADLIVGTNGVGYLLYQQGLSGPTSFGLGGLQNASSGSGDRFAIIGNTHQLAVPSGYVSNSPINGSAVFSGTTLSGLGLTPGTYNYTVPNDTITVVIESQASVPEPGPMALAAAASLAAGAAWLWRRRAAARG